MPLDLEPGGQSRRRQADACGDLVPGPVCGQVKGARVEVLRIGVPLAADVEVRPAPAVMENLGAEPADLLDPADGTVVVRGLAYPQPEVS
jgi:hypothetical protein